MLTTTTIYQMIALMTVFVPDGQTPKAFNYKQSLLSHPYVKLLLQRDPRIEFKEMKNVYLRIYPIKNIAGQLSPVLLCDGNPDICDTTEITAQGIILSDNDYRIYLSSLDYKFSLAAAVKNEGDRWLVMVTVDATFYYPN
jgi:hypothetical protein